MGLIHASVGEKRAERHRPIHHYITQGLRADDSFSLFPINDNTTENALMHSLSIALFQGFTVISSFVCCIKHLAGFVTCDFTLNQCSYFKFILNCM